MIEDFPNVKIRREYRSFDYVLLVLVLALCVFGAVMVYSAINGHSEAYLAANPAIAAIFPRHIVFLSLGILILFAAERIFWRRVQFKIVVQGG
jgi:cell division protein FtsW (lipid II flippase)